MGPGEHRPRDKEYWQRPWAQALFAGDLFEAIPFGDQPTAVYTAEQGEASGKHFLGEATFGYGLLITPTCDMAEQHGASPAAAHPYRVLVPVLPLDLVTRQTAAIEQSLGLLRSRDAKLFAPKLIHESQNCSNLHSLPRILPEEDNHYSRSTMSSSEL